jgi:hypothetical protein
MTSATLMKKLLPATLAVSALALTLSAPAQAAGFAGDYAPGNFALSNLDTNGSVNTLAAPTSITLFGGNDTTQNPNSGLTSYLTTAAASGVVSFNWNYQTADLGFGGSISGQDPFGYILDNVVTYLTVDTVGNQSGTASFNVLAGQSFGFALDTADNFGGRGQATISNFMAPSAAPIPTPAVLPGLIGLGLGMMRKRKAGQTAN